jgi:hypothetical protein
MGVGNPEVRLISQEAFPNIPTPMNPSKPEPCHIIRRERNMSNSGLKQARKLTGEGFHYDNLLKMAEHCREETQRDRILSAYVLNRVFSEMAQELGEGPVLLSELRKLEAKYRTALNLALESAINGAPHEEQNRRLTELIILLWSSPKAE